MKEHSMLKPQPRVTELNRPFWSGCNEGRLMIQRCAACARAVFYPRVCCPFCRHGELDWIQASGRGKIISHTTVHRTHHDSFNAEAPYVFAAVELEEGPCLYAQLRGAPTDGTSLIGCAVAAEFVDHGPGLKIAAFRLA
jgi:uncharacterized OB-fold protein